MDIKNEIPKLEQIRPNDVLAFTINPEAQYFYDADRMDKVIRLLKNRLRGDSYSYKLYIEVSPKGRIHGHGWVQIANPLNFYLFDIPRIIKDSTICIKIIDNDELWDDYCWKQAHIVRKIISRILPLFSDSMLQSTLEEYGFSIQ